MRATEIPLALFLLLAATFGGPGSALAQGAGDFPNRPIRVVVPVAAGAGIDTAARITAAAAEKNLGQKFIIENKPDASLRLGASLVAHAQPDGYTLLFTSPTPIVLAEFIPPKLDFDPARDFQPVISSPWQMQYFSRYCWWCGPRSG